MTILFLHGLHSLSKGVKPSYLIQHGHTVINPKLPDDDFEQAVQIAQQEFDEHQPDVVVGSSRGGAVAINIDSGETRLVLLCPAWKKWGTAKTVRSSTVILHSKNDDVIPFADSEKLIIVSELPASALIEFGNDHILADQEPLEKMLGVRAMRYNADARRLSPSSFHENCNETGNHLHDFLVKE